MSKYVISSPLSEAAWTNSTMLKGDAGEAFSNLRQQLDGHIVVHGSAQRVQTLPERDLVDELRLIAVPIVLRGRQATLRRHERGEAHALAESRTVGDGVAILIHRPARDRVKESVSD